MYIVFCGILVLLANRLIHLQYFTRRLTCACVYQRVYTRMHVPLRVLVCVSPHVLLHVCLRVPLHV